MLSICINKVTLIIATTIVKLMSIRMSMRVVTDFRLNVYLIFLINLYYFAKAKQFVVKINFHPIVPLHVVRKRKGF